MSEQAITISDDSRREIIIQRNKNNITQENLGYMTSIKKSIIRDIENGKTIPTDREIYQIEKVLGIKIRFSINVDITINDIKRNWKLIEYAKKPTPEMDEIAVKKNWQALEFVKNKTPYLCALAVEKNWRAMKFIDNQTTELCTLAFKQDWKCIKFMKIQHPEACYAAVKNNGLSIEYIIDQTPELCSLAIQQNWKALEHIKKQTNELCSEAIAQNYLAITRVRKPTHRLCIKAIDKNFEAIKIITFRPLLLMKENASPLIEDHCGICLENHLSSTDTWSQLLACRHKFHTKCFMLCYKGSAIKKCPLCRTNYFIPEEN